MSTIQAKTDEINASRVHLTLARVSPSRRSWMRYGEDRSALACVVFTLVLGLIPIWAPLPAWALVLYLPIAWLSRLPTASIQHHQSHLTVFTRQPLNFIYDLCLMMVTGYATPIWEIQHGRGHHRQYLRPETDVTRVERFGDPEGLFGHIRYTFLGDFLIVSDSYQIAMKERPSERNRLLVRLTTHLILQVLLTAIFLKINPAAGILFFIVPNLLTRYMVWWSAYWHHKDFPTTDLFDSSTNKLDDLFNRITFNSGHHTAHHEKPTLHWSRLPERTKILLPKIPGYCLRSAASKHVKLQALS